MPGARPFRAAWVSDEFPRRSLMPMTTYTVQYILPVDNPVSNVSMERKKSVTIFLVPINHPDAHNMGYADLIAAAELSGLRTVSIGHNNKKSDIEGKSH